MPWTRVGSLLRSSKSSDIINDIYNTTLGVRLAHASTLPLWSLLSPFGIIYTLLKRSLFLVYQSVPTVEMVSLFLLLLSNIEFEFIDGVYGDKVPDKVITQTNEYAFRCCYFWMLACSYGRDTTVSFPCPIRVVKRNLNSALILEDDVDWDVRIREQLYNMALSTQALIQPLAGTITSFADKTYQPRTYPPPPKVPAQGIPEFPIERLPKTAPATSTPYGDVWDLLWVGHRGMVMPPAGSPIPEGRVISLDESVPEMRHLFSLMSILTIPASSTMQKMSACTLGCAITQRGARALLQEIALKDVDDAVDMLLRLCCEGGVGRRSHTCLTVQPSLFNSHRPEGPMESYSNIRNWDGWQYEASTDITRWSVRLNVDRLLDGRELWDQLPDQNED
ncbi:unnamed protein product, partial [Clonostachys chloroleuca]